MSVLWRPSPGSRSGLSLMDASNDKLCGHGLFHRDHSQLLCGRVTPLSYPPLGIPPLEPMDTLLAPTLETCWPLLVLVEVAGDEVNHEHPPFLASAKRGPWHHNSGRPPPEGRRKTRRLLTGSRCTHLNTPLEYDAPPPSRAPPLVPVRVVRSWPGKMKMPGVGPHLEGLKADTSETDPPPEDPANAGEAYSVTILWMRCLTTWPQDGNETSRT